MAQLALYTCPVLVRPPTDPGQAAFRALDEAVIADLASAPPPGLVRVFARLDPPRRWPRHVAALAGTPKPTLSVWRDLDAAFAYSYGPGLHREALRRRREWFTLQTPVYVLWYAAAPAAVTHDAAVARLERLATGGPAPEAFDFRHPFDPDGRPVDPARFAALRRDQDRPGGGVGGRRRPLPLPLRDGPR